MAKVSSPLVEEFLYWISFFIVLGLLIYSIFLAKTTSASCQKYELDIHDYENIADFLSSDEANFLKSDDEYNIQVDGIKVLNSLQFGIAVFDTFVYDSGEKTFKINFKTKEKDSYFVYNVTGTSTYDDDKGYYFVYNWDPNPNHPFFPSP